MKKLTLLVWLLMVATAFADGTSGGGGGGGGGGAPTDSTYFVKSSEGGLSAESVVQTNGTGVSVTYNTVPDPDTVTFALDTAANITWGGTWATTGTFSTTNSLTLGAVGYLIGLGTTEAQATCAAGGGCIFYEQSSDKWRVSQNGGAYADLVAAGGTDLSAVPFVTTATSALLSGENVLTQGVGIDITTTGGTTTLGIDTVTVACSGDFSIVANAFDFCQSGIAFEGTAANTVEGYLVYDNPSVEQTIHIPDLPGTDNSAILITDSDSGTVTGTMILDGTVSGDDIGIATTTGDMLYWNGTTWVRLGIGSVDDVLTVEGGLPGWSPNACVGGGIEVSTATFLVAEGTEELSAEQVITDGDAIAWTTGDLTDPDTITANLLFNNTFFDVVGTELTIVEAGLEGTLDLQDLQGAVTDAQVPNTITVNNATTATALAADGTNCSAGSYPLGVDASGVVQNCTVAGMSSPATLFAIKDEFMSAQSQTIAGDLSWAVGLSGTGTNVLLGSTSIDENHPGQILCDTGTTVTGRCNLNLGASTVALTGGALTYTWSTRLEDLSTVAEEYIYRIGLGDSPSADFTDGVYFQYDRLNAATPGNWYAKVAGTNTRTQCDGDGDEGGADGVDGTPVAVAADTWYRLTAEVNTAATSVVFKVSTSGGADVTICTITGANIPTASEKVGPYVSIISSAYTAIEKTFYLDYFDMTKVVAR